MMQLLELELQTPLTSAITIDPFGFLYQDPQTDILQKILSVPPSSAIELVTGGAKFVMQSTDVLKVQSDTATSADVYVSAVDSISA
jgi:hypothetical protein